MWIQTLSNVDLRMRSPPCRMFGTVEEDWCFQGHKSDSGSSDACTWGVCAQPTITFSPKTLSRGLGIASSCEMFSLCNLICISLIREEMKTPIISCVKLGPSLLSMMSQLCCQCITVDRLWKIYKAQPSERLLCSSDPLHHPSPVTVLNRDC